jgi:P4 family phage/plasmid primase-like protien
MFLRPDWADEEGVWDGARQAAGGLAIDFKTKCKSGTRGVLSVAPSPGKKWIPGRSPWEAELVEVSRELLEAIGVKNQRKSKPRSKTSKVSPDLSVHTESSTEPPSPPDALPPLSNNGEIAQLVGILSAERAHGWHTWIRVGFCLKNESVKTGVDHFPLWDQFSQKSTKYNAGECEKEWENMKLRTDGSVVSSGSLYYWAQKDDPQGYIEVIAQSTNVRMCNGTHNDVARIASKFLQGKFVCVTSNGKMWYRFDGSLWKEDLDGIQARHALSSTVRAAFVQEIPRILMEDDARSVVSSATGGGSLMNGNSEAKNTAKIMFATAHKLQDSGFKDSVMKELREYMLDKDFPDRLDSNPNLVAFTNGVWDLKSAWFRPATPEDHVSMSVRYDYSEEDGEEDKAKIDRYWRTLHPEDEQRLYMMRMFGRQLYGDSGNEKFHFHAGVGGSAANGKTKFFDVLEHAAGDYVCKFGVEMLTAKNRIEPGKPMPEYASWRGVRFLYCTEPNSDDTINSGIMKDKSGGEMVKYRALYSNDIQSFRPMYKLHLMCNDTPNVDGTDSGVKRRIVKVDYISTFVDAADANPAEHKYPRDSDMIEAFKESTGLRMAFLRVLLRAYDHTFAFEPPASVRTSSRMFIEENDSVFGFVNECVAQEKGAWFTLAQAKEAFQASQHYKNKIKTLKTDLQKALGVKSHDQKWLNKGKEINVFMDFKLSMPKPTSMAGVGGSGMMLDPLGE